MFFEIYFTRVPMKVNDLPGNLLIYRLIIITNESGIRTITACSIREALFVCKFAMLHCLFAVLVRIQDSLLLNWLPIKRLPGLFNQLKMTGAVFGVIVCYKYIWCL